MSNKERPLEEPDDETYDWDKHDEQSEFREEAQACEYCQGETNHTIFCILTGEEDER